LSDNYLLIKLSSAEPKINQHVAEFFPSSILYAAAGHARAPVADAPNAAGAVGLQQPVPGFNAPVLGHVVAR
jgi:hypothetical protein